MDPTVVATPGFLATMVLEDKYLKRRAARTGVEAPTDYERSDTITSLAMGVGSLLAPLIVPKLTRPITPGRGRYGKALLVAAASSIAVTTVADVVARWGLDRDGQASHPRGAAVDRGTRDAVIDDEVPTDPRARRRAAARRIARKVASIGGVASVATAGVALTTAWASATEPSRLWEKRVLPDLGGGPGAFAVAMLGWDFIYYLNHRLMHTSRAMWAIHVVHHSSERYNLSTALRQPVADALGMFVPYGIMSLLGIRPSLIMQARGYNLIYQYWIHTDAIGHMGRFEDVFNTPSLHRVHHGSNQKYLDRNHAGILIIWDRMLGTHQLEEETVIYGLTKNLDSFNAATVVGHEHKQMLANVSRATTWRDRVAHLVRGPGWKPTADVVVASSAA